VIVGAAAALFPSCGGETQSAGRGPSLWLSACAGAADCGGLSCLCGVCTKKCDAAPACASLSAATTCERVYRCGGGATACVVPCDGNAACAKVGPGLTCSDGQCLPASASKDASVGGKGDAARAQDATTGVVASVDAGRCGGDACDASTPCCDGFYCAMPSNSGVSLGVHMGSFPWPVPDGLSGGRCYPRGSIPCDPTWSIYVDLLMGRLDLQCPSNLQYGRSASPRDSCCAPLGSTGLFACVDPAKNPAACGDKIKKDAGPPG
jgi:hypothetical protein